MSFTELLDSYKYTSSSSSSSSSSLRWYNSYKNCNNAAKSIPLARSKSDSYDSAAAAAAAAICMKNNLRNFIAYKGSSAFKKV